MGDIHRAHVACGLSKKDIKQFLGQFGVNTNQKIAVSVEGCRKHLLVFSISSDSGSGTHREIYASTLLSCFNMIGD